MEIQMKAHCNPLLKSWNRHLKDAEKFVALRRDGRGFIVARLKKKGSR